MSSLKVSKFYSVRNLVEITSLKMPPVLVLICGLEMR